MSETELASQPVGTQPVVPAWRFFTTEVARLRRLSPSFLRVTFTGADLDEFADNGFDQRINLVLPNPAHGFAHLPDGPDWYAQWRRLPEHRRNPFRTYTVRAVRPRLREVDVDIVLHDDGGPAARWAGAARTGDQLMIMGPDRRYPSDHGGREFRPPPEARTLLLAGDETAVPAICAIVERLPAGSRGEVLLEVPDRDDVLPLSAPPLVTVTWLARSGAPHGSRLVPALRAAAGRLLPGSDAGPPDAGSPTAGRPRSGGSIGNQPGAGGSIGNQPGAGGSIGNQPGAGGSIGEQPDAGGSIGEQPDAGGSIGNQPDAGGSDVRQPYSGGSGAEVPDLAGSVADGSATGGSDTGASDTEGSDTEGDAEILWEVPDGAPAGRIYGWLAGEAGVVRALRRHLVAERGLDRAALAFMGYWRLGRADDD